MGRGPDPRSTAEGLAALRRTFQTAVGRSDLEATAGAYAHDARLILSTGIVIDGRAAIEGYWRAGFEAGTSGLELVPDAFEVGDGVAWEFGTYGLSAQPPYESMTTEWGRYLTVHRRAEDGQWRRAVDLFSPTGLKVISRTTDIDLPGKGITQPRS